MKAIVYEQYGSPDVLQIKEASKPTTRDNEILIRVQATTVTVADARVRAFRVPLSFWLPARIALGIRKPKQTILGAEMAGEVEAVGKDVKRFKKGDRVFASTVENGFGAYAEYTVLPEDGIVAKIPADLSYEEAATIPVGGRTALYFLREANIQSGQKVLIHGASGSVGTFAVQLAKYFGAHVTGVSSTRNLELVKSLGADEVIDYTRQDFTRNGESYDVIFDTVGKASFSDSLKSLTEEGAYLQAVAVPATELRMRWAAMTSSRKTVGGGPPPDYKDLDFLGELVAAGKIRPVIDREYSMEDIVEAHRYVDTERKRGNVVVRVAPGEQETTQFATPGEEFLSLVAAT
jgi:NADPH:quinone reductase-like Zn-dependent oxidoreductase